MLLRGLTAAAFSSDSAAWKITRQSNFGAEEGKGGFWGVVVVVFCFVYLGIGGDYGDG